MLLLKTKSKLLCVTARNATAKPLLPSQLKLVLSAVSEARCAFSSSKRPGFFTQIVDNIKEEITKNKEMKENIAKFRKEAEKLEQSEALKSARQKFNTVESEATKSKGIIKEKMGTIKEKFTEALEEAGRSDIGKKATEISQEFSKTARELSGTIAEKSHQIGQSEAFQTVSQASQVVRKEINSQGMSSRVYKSPDKLRKRNEIASAMDNRQFEPNAEILGLELHKDSKLYQSWENFKNNNTYVNRVLDWKVKYDESENPLIRASRLLTEKVSDVMGNLFSKTELSETLTELCKLDPNFDEKKFIRDCENDYIPNILEALVRGNMEILRDWCSEGVYNLLAAPIQQAQKAGLHLDSKILDIENVDLVMGKVMDQGPVLVITFQSQQIMSVRNIKNEIVEGDPEKVMRVNYVWVLSRDPDELNPKAAWRLLELSASSSEQLV